MLYLLVRGIASEAEEAMKFVSNEENKSAYSNDKVLPS